MESKVSMSANMNVTSSNSPERRRRSGGRCGSREGDSIGVESAPSQEIAPVKRNEEQRRPCRLTAFLHPSSMPHHVRQSSLSLWLGFCVGKVFFFPPPPFPASPLISACPPLIMVVMDVILSRRCRLSRFKPLAYPCFISLQPPLSYDSHISLVGGTRSAVPQRHPILISIIKTEASYSRSLRPPSSSMTYHNL
ncbi:hypothetical protein IE53DRAFT_280952 [Violaceomyces palustris]|uniref:Uncharacterized protein n=1 Tax=Violaceomyces palustris TaxID=1673888 RepID=A0ACD0NMG5_9BASI|nr:hypothetical protein IE53DRAFT_280952 [Violaceomyces palustris]